MDLEELRTVRNKERRTDSLQHLRDEFYDEATEYVRQLKRERWKHVEAGDPFNPETKRLTDEIDAAQETIESLYERRRGKLVKNASFAAAGRSVETDGMTDQERELFDDLVERIQANEEHVLGKMDVGTETASQTASATSTTTPAADPAQASAGPRDGPTDDGVTIGREAGSADETEGRAAPAVAATTGDTPEAAEAASRATDDTVPAGGDAAGPSGDAPGTTDDTPTLGASEGSQSDDAGGVLAEAMGGDTRASDRQSGADGVSTDTHTTADATASGTGSRPAAGPAGGSTGPDAATPTTETDDDRPAAEAAAVIGEADTPQATTGDASEASGPAVGGSNTEPSGPSAETGVEADEPGIGSDESDTTADNPESVTEDTPEIEREAVRVTRDVGEVYGVDEQSYELAAGDTVLLPAANVEPLVDRDAAERL